MRSNFCRGHQQTSISAACAVLGELLENKFTMATICLRNLLRIFVLVVPQYTTVHASENLQVGLVEAGRKAFFDKRLSPDNSTSCATCHRPDRAFQDSQKTSRGIHGAIGSRNAPSLIGMSDQKTFFWDGRRSSLEMQALDPLFNPREMGNATKSNLVGRLRNIPEYSIFFPVNQDHGDDRSLLTISNGRGKARHTSPPQTRYSEVLSRLGDALASYEKTIQDGDSPFDRYISGRDEKALSSAQQRGWQLFNGKAQCIQCHKVTAGELPRFTDDSFHSLPLRKEVRGKTLADIVAKFTAMRNAGKTVDWILIKYQDISELGRFVVTGNSNDIGGFRTPSLRNVALTAPYMHDGSMSTLEEVIEIELYYRGLQEGRPIILSPDEKKDISEFLQSLTGWEGNNEKQASSVDGVAVFPAGTR